VVDELAMKDPINDLLCAARDFKGTENVNQYFQTYMRKLPLEDIKQIKVCHKRRKVTKQNPNATSICFPRIDLLV